MPKTLSFDLTTIHSSELAQIGGGYSPEQQAAFQREHDYVLRANQQLAKGGPIPSWIDPRQVRSIAVTPEGQRTSIRYMGP